MKVGERVYSEAEVQEMRAALNWIVGFCDSLRTRHTGFVDIQRRAKAALESNTESERA